jgi:HK97 family phage major capsid protein
MDQEQINKLIAQIADEMQAKSRAGIQPLEEEITRMKADVAEVLKSSRDIRRAALQSSNNRPRVDFGPYQGMDRLDLAVSQSILNAGLKNPQGLDFQKLERWQNHLKAAMDSTSAGAGDELVPTEQARQLWMDINLQTVVASLFPTINMPSNPFEIPLQLGDVNWYPGTENTAGTSTNLTTAKQTLTAYELVAEVPWSYTLEEDAVIAMMEEVRASLTRNGREVMDDIVLNADTTGLNNINADGTTITTSTAGKAHFLLGFDGLLHLPLIDNTGQANSHGAAVSDDMFNEIRAKLGKYGVRPGELAFISDINTYIRCLGVENFRTIDKFGPQYTLRTGQLGAVEGIPFLVSEQMRLADTDGKVTSGGNLTDTGRLLLVNHSQWRKGFRREMSIETDRNIQTRQHIMVVSFRMAFAERSGNRATATHTALQYNITGL